MKLRKLCEEFKDGIKSSVSGEYYEIYKNPDKKDFLALKKQSPTNDLRIIIDKKNSDIYVFPAELLHKDAEEKLRLNDDDLIKTTVAYLGNGMMSMNSFLEAVKNSNRNLLRLFGEYFR